MTGHFDVNAAGMRTLRAVHIKEDLDLFQYAIERPRLVTARRGDGVAVHGITAPYDLFAGFLYGADELRQSGGSFVVAEPADEGQPAGLVGRV